MKISKELKNSTQIGSICILTYLVSYVSRNILSVVTPMLTSDGVFTKSYLGMLSTIYFAVYSAGQLLNGFLGDRIRSKYMIFCGCFFSSVGMAVFPIINNPVFNVVSFALLGFGLSMLRGPLMKIIAENTPSKTAEFVCVLFSVASFAGPLIASLFSIIFKWKTVFFVTAIFAMIMAIASFVVITLLENKGVIVFKPKNENIFKDIKKLFFIRNFMFYLLVGAIVEIAASSITFWIPTYLSEYLRLSNEISAVIFSIISLLKMISPFICIFIYHNIIKNDVILNLVLFGLSAVFFIALMLTRNCPLLNVIFFILAKLTTGCAATTLWSVYIPRLAKYGCVSTGNGVFDFTGYAAASLSNAFFSGCVDSLGWNGLIISWTVIMILGFGGALTSEIFNRKKQ